MGTSIRKSKERTLIIGLAFTIGLSVLIFRLLWLQTVDSGTLSVEAQKNWLKNQVLRPKRGTIYDRSHRKELAKEVDAYVFGADLKQVENPEQTAEILSPLLQVPVDQMLNKLSQNPTKNKKSVELRFPGRYKYGQEVFEKIKEIKGKNEDQLSGIYAFPTKMRKYSGTSTAHVNGFLNSAGKPVGGIEAYYDSLLNGKQGEAVYKKAKNGMMIEDEPQKFLPPKHGKDLVLTLDLRIQKQVEKELKKAMKMYDAKGGTAIVADPKTGGILAMVNRPTFDPNNASDTYKPKNSHNMAVESQFEPGSTFKIITLAAAIEEKVFNPQETFKSGAIQVEDRIIRDWKPDGWGEITFKEGVELSSNVAFVKLGQKLGQENLINYIKKFGFGDITNRIGRKTGIDLPAEGTGYYFKGPLYPSELANVSFGQGLSVTPIQQVMAVSAIANGGKLYKPHLLKEVWDAEKEKKITEVKPKGQRILSPSTAKKVRQLLRDVVKHGTGVEASLPGYQVAGKTGTAQKPNPDGSGYLPNKYIVSFIGFAPAENPEVVVYIALDEPSSPSGDASGGSVAAPIARKVLKESLQVREVDKHHEQLNVK